jgi:hypothetical protein
MRLKNCSLLVVVALLVLSGCPADRFRWNFAHAYLSPRARQLPRAELEEIIRLVSYATPEIIIGVGQSCTERGLDEMHVVTGYTNDRVTVFDLKKSGGKWRIVDRGDASPSLSTVEYNC